MSNIFDHAVLSDFLDPGITAASYISQTSNHGNKENLFPGSHIWPEFAVLWLTACPGTEGRRAPSYGKISNEISAFFS